MRTVRGVGPRLAERLAATGVRTVRDLAFWPPRSYRDFRTITPLGEIREGEWQVVAGTVAGSVASGPRWRRRLIVRLAGDEGTANAGTIALVWFRAYPGQSARFPVGAVVVAGGVPGRYRDELQMVHPMIAGVGDPGADGFEVQRGVVPVYPSVTGFDPRRLRRVVAAAASTVREALEDPVPASIRAERALAGLAETLGLLHDPTPLLAKGVHPEALREHPRGPWRRMAYEEAFLLGIAVARARAAEARRPAPRILVDPKALAAVLGTLGFTLTASQARAIDVVRSDLASDRPMRRLLQGDVGSGKTAVALAAVAMAAASGRQAAVLAPTEILADQHAERLGTALAAADIAVTRLSGGLRARRRRDAVRSISVGAARVAVGTHALLEDPVVFSRLGLVVIDEQQRFGVHQRFVLSRAKAAEAGTTPHLLVMTATPIPRTLALALYGDLDVTTLDEMPPGRQPVRTEACGPAERAAAYDRAVDRARAGERIYVICPLVEPSEAADLPSATAVADDLSRRLPEGHVALLHGRLLPEEKIAAVARFRSGQARVLVSTSVVEVGVDVPEAAGVLVDGADRFGLSQLHQIRGRVGRDGRAAWCVLVRSSDREISRRRVDMLVGHHDGFRIAEADLELRGAGDLFGVRQAGAASFRFADPARDASTIAEAVRDAHGVVAGDVAMSDAEAAALDDAVLRFERSWGGTYDEGAG